MRRFAPTVASALSGPPTGCLFAVTGNAVRRYQTEPLKKAAPAAPELQKAAPAAPEPLKKAAPAAPEPLKKAAPAAPELQKAAPAAPELQKAAPAAPELQKAAPAAPELQKAAPAAPELQKAAPAAPELQKAAPAAPELQKAAPAAPELQKAAPAASELQKAAPAAPELQKAAPAAPELQKAAPAAPELQKAAPAAPELQKAAPAAPELQKAAPAAPELQKAAPAAPELQKAAPAAPELQKAAPAAPELQKAAPAAPELQKAAPAAPELQKAAPAAPELQKAAPAAPELQKAAPAAPELQKAAPAAPELQKAAPAAPELQKAAPAAPELQKAAPAAPELQKAAPAAPELQKAAPAAPELQKAAPAAPELQKAAPAAPELQKAAPAAPELQKAAPAAPELQKAAPAAPELQKAAPAAPELQKAAPAAPEPQKAAPAAPELQKAAPAAPELQKAAPAAPELQKAAPAAPELQKAAPAAPELQKAAPAAPELQKAAPAAPELQKAAPAAPELQKAAPAAPELQKAAPAAPELQKTAPVNSMTSTRKSRGRFTGDDRASGLDGERGRLQRSGGAKEGRNSKREVGYSQKEKIRSRGDTYKGNRDVSLSNVVEDIQDIKIVFASHNPSPSKRQVPSAPKAAPRAPDPPKAPLAPPAAPSMPSDFVASSKPVSGSRNDTRTTIAPPTASGDPQDTVWAKSSALSLDEEIERARATRPLVRSPVIVGREIEGLSLNFEHCEKSEPIVELADKSGLKELSEKEATLIDNHMVPDDFSGGAFMQKHTGVTHDVVGEKELSELSVNNTVTAASLETSLYGKEEQQPKESDGRSNLSSTVSSCITEHPPLAPWTCGAFTAQSGSALLKLSFDESSQHIVTITLWEPLVSTISAVRALNEAITAIENHSITISGPVTHVVLTSLPGIAFFQPKHSPLELSCSERIELIREKERLFLRMGKTPPLNFVAIVNGGSLDDFAAELFLACHYRVFLDATHTTFGFPSCLLGDFPTSHAVRQLCRYFGAQRTLAASQQQYRFTAATLLDAGVARHARDTREGLTALRLSYVDHSKALPPTSLLLRLENALLAFLNRPALRDFVLRRFFLTRSTGGSSVEVYSNPITQAWRRYCLAAMAKRGVYSQRWREWERVRSGGNRDAARSEGIYSEFLFSPSAVNAARIYGHGCEIQRRVLSSPPYGGYLRFKADEAELWPRKVRALSAESCNQGTVLLDCGKSNIEAMKSLVKDQSGALTKANVVIIGDEYVARPLIPEFNCVATISPVSAYAVSPLRDLQEVRLFGREGCPEHLRASTLSAALAYLQQEYRPYVVCRHSCSGRLIAAFVTEACRIAMHCDIEKVERVSTGVLRLLGGPFRLADHLGTSTVSRLIEETSHMNDHRNPLIHDWLPSIGYQVLRSMSNDGFGGTRTRRGGFYTYGADGSSVALNTVVQKQYLRRHLTDTELSDRLLSVVVNECCELLLSGHLLTAADANALTIATLGFSETTGGALTLADAMGAGLMLQKMEELAVWHGAHLQPSPLLKCMAHSRVSFATLSEAVIQSARM
ncbi:hypothetical protein, conserved [Trypanosoma brucei gambiense DAL972]|uniref:3-hydroxyacyl-CoA dehydrogenase C-terminal domain-containing protein n=1 Tax=Trypanosoma brucei gambiense (strain MHOM/CI/86/DAL972) TaxID=679716 RepID=D0A2C9_TRYB9|nr:LOW QUALITY PROTEIN: hypothetical protein, conserved [Trypanosoma brucei gambiense DAL972]CBH15423.1 hypothetical protein, conserved [Trypanosoma brucei gambiense DAL972]|eukprot:XP_011777687.1 LOW QUALITY PROTEIN: hypothetical protein, conserved [Trypanosoma brucei gambiense DAL972]